MVLQLIDDTASSAQVRIGLGVQRYASTAFLLELSSPPGVRYRRRKGNRGPPTPQLYAFSPTPTAPRKPLQDIDIYSKADRYLSLWKRNKIVSVFDHPFTKDQVARHHQRSAFECISIVGILVIHGED